MQIANAWCKANWSKSGSLALESNHHQPIGPHLREWDDLHRRLSNVLKSHCTVITQMAEAVNHGTNYILGSSIADKVEANHWTYQMAITNSNTATVLHMSGGPFKWLWVTLNWTRVHTSFLLWFMSTCVWSCLFRI